MKSNILSSKNERISIECTNHAIIYTLTGNNNVKPQMDCYSVFTPKWAELDIKDLLTILEMEYVTRIVFEDNPNIDSNVYRVEIDNSIEETLWDETTRQIEKYLGIDTSAEHIEQYYNEFMWNLYGESDDDKLH